MDFDNDPCSVQRACARRSPWHVMVGCLLLNLTSRVQVKKVLPELFKLVPEAEALEELSEEGQVQLVALLSPLGLVNKRVKALITITDGYLAGLPPEVIPHCGQYCLDSFDIFVRHIDVEPRTDMDKELVQYLLWKYRSDNDHADR